MAMVIVVMMAQARLMPMNRPDSLDGVPVLVAVTNTKTCG